MTDFAGKVALVTGAGQGIGFEICRSLSALGAIVVLNDLDTALTSLACEKITQETGHKCLPVPGDAGDPEFIKSLVGEGVREFGRVDIAIANAGITLFGDFMDYSPESLSRVLQVNIGGSFFLAQAAARQMKKQGKGGSILFMSSVTGHQAHKDLAAYSMSKAALEMLAKSLVIELSQYKITVNTVAPGATLTERTLTNQGYEDVWSKITPMGRPATTQDIAEAVIFLVSPKARHITGQSLVIDGGWTSISPSPF